MSDQKPPDRTDDASDPPDDDPADLASEGQDEDPVERSWLRIYVEEFRDLEVDQRVELARTASEERLRALCHDPSPRVVRGVLDNANTGLEHARLLARHHRTGLGLEMLGRRSQFLLDPQVQRLLFRNVQTPSSLLLRMLARWRMSQVYRLTISRDTTQRVRAEAKKEFRKKFAGGTAEERVQLILKCEGRCLGLLLGIALDGKSVALLCRRPLASTLLIRNLLRWPSSPPPLLEHMAKQPVVRRNKTLANQILRHPNAPSRLQVGR